MNLFKISLKYFSQFKIMFVHPNLLFLFNIFILKFIYFLRLTKQLQKTKTELKEVELNSKKELLEREKQLAAETAALDAEKLKNASLQVSLLILFFYQV